MLCRRGPYFTFSTPVIKRQIHFSPVCVQLHCKQVPELVEVILTDLIYMMNIARREAKARSMEFLPSVPSDAFFLESGEPLRKMEPPWMALQLLEAQEGRFLGHKPPHNYPLVYICPAPGLQLRLGSRYHCVWTLNTLKRKQGCTTLSA